MNNTGLDRMIEDSIFRPLTFVCDWKEFDMRYGRLSIDDMIEANKYVILCQDGMIRPRSPSEMDKVTN